MDPITQGAVGAVAAKLGSKPSRYFHAAVIGALAGMAPDLDVLIRSDTDPLLTLEYHRQFTHSLLFIPILGGLCGLLLYWLLGRRWQLSLSQTLLWSILGCATHGLLDGCTSYGTKLLWPLSEQRFAWDSISVVDPLFTLPLIIAIVVSIKRSSPYWLAAGISWALLYLGAGYLQHERATVMGHEIATARGHQPLRLEAKPSFANIAVWKVVYETEDRFYVDAVKPGIFDNMVWQGDSIAKLNTDTAFPWLPDTAQQHQDIARFDNFSAGYIAIDQQHPMRVVDIRYSLLPHHINALWGIELSREKSLHEHVDFFTQREDSSAALKKLLGMIFE